VPDADRKAFDRLAADDKWKDLGRRVVAAKGCANCHTLPKDVPAAKAPDLAAIAKRSGRGCLAESPDPAKVPAYPLDAGRRAALAAFLADRSPPAPGYATRAAIKRFNCLNCHIRDGEGGIGTELADRMKALEKGESADNDVLPPRLTGVGHKARPGWLRSVLLAGGRARPWMGLRMPQYGETNVGGLPEALAAGDGAAPEAEAKPAAVVSSQIEAGRKLAGKEGLGCIGCHDVSGFAGGGTRGPDLALTSQRVRPDWYRRWMHNPQRLAPGTRMPQNFNDGRSAFAGVLNGDAETQIDALWAYFALGPGLPLPAGLEPPKGLVIPVRERPEILRTFLPDGAGTRAVAVGYPGGVNLAFDAHAARLAYAWEGNFLDASPVWTNRGGAPAKLLGPKFLVAPSGNPWAVTAGDSPPDFTKRADDYAWGKAVPNDAIYAGRMNVRFEGYALDAGGRPTFRYRVGERDDATLGVADTPSPARSGVATGLTRRFALDLPAGGRTVWLLGGVSEKPPRTTGSAVGSTVVLPDAGRATVLRLSAAPAGSEWWLVRADAGWQAVLRIPTGAGGTASVELTTWALPRDDDGLLPGLGR
jgi:cytochrome c553